MARVFGVFDVRQGHVHGAVYREKRAFINIRIILLPRNAVPLFSFIRTSLERISFKKADGAIFSMNQAVEKG